MPKKKAAKEKIADTNGDNFNEQEISFTNNDIAFNSSLDQDTIVIKNNVPNDDINEDQVHGEGLVEKNEDIIADVMKKKGKGKRGKKKVINTKNEIEEDEETVIIKDSVIDDVPNGLITEEQQGDNVSNQVLQEGIDKDPKENDIVDNADQINGDERRTIKRKKKKGRAKGAKNMKPKKEDELDFSDINDDGAERNEDDSIDNPNNIADEETVINKDSDLDDVPDEVISEEQHKDNFSHKVLEEEIEKDQEEDNMFDTSPHINEDKTAASSGKKTNVKRPGRPKGSKNRKTLEGQRENNLKQKEKLASPEKKSSTPGRGRGRPKTKGRRGRPPKQRESPLGQVKIKLPLSTKRKSINKSSSGPPPKKAKRGRGRPPKSSYLGSSDSDPNAEPTGQRVSMSLMERFNTSTNNDRLMWQEAIKGSQVYAAGLEKIGILTESELNSINDGLEKLASEWQDKSFILKEVDEDIHTANQRRLKELIGDAAEKLYTGRSRNDQVATDTRLWLIKKACHLQGLLKSLVTVFIDRAADEIDILMPGYTHLQKAQPIRWSQWLLSHTWCLKEDLDRLEEIKKRINQLSLGSGALAGNPFGIDREFLAEKLQSTNVIENSPFGTIGRDFVAEFLFWASLTMTHLSKWAEDLIIYNSKEFSFINICDTTGTDTNLAPKKKNPDSLKLIRGKSARVFGSMSGFMKTLKGLLSTYDKDFQEDEELLFDAVETMEEVLEVAQETLKTLTVNKENCLNALSPEMLLPDVANYLVRKGVPFRKAHVVAGSVVQVAEKKGVSLMELSHSDFSAVDELFGDDIKDIWSYEASVEQYNSTGGTSRVAITNQISSFRKWLNNLSLTMWSLTSSDEL